MCLYRPSAVSSKRTPSSGSFASRASSHRTSSCCARLIVCSCASFTPASDFLACFFAAFKLSRAFERMSLRNLRRVSKTSSASNALDMVALLSLCPSQSCPVCSPKECTNVSATTSAAACTLLVQGRRPSRASRSFCVSEARAESSFIASTVSKSLARCLRTLSLHLSLISLNSADPRVHFIWSAASTWELQSEKNRWKRWRRLAASSRRCDEKVHELRYRCPRQKKRKSSAAAAVGWPVYISSNSSRTVMKFFRLLLILRPSMCRCPACSHSLTHSLPLRKCASHCAISLQWCGKHKSTPPLWISSCSPKREYVIALHSMCQPGRPGPHLDSQLISPGFDVFHSAKSRGLFFSPSAFGLSPSSESTASRSFGYFMPSIWENLATSKYTPDATAYAKPFSSIFSTNARISSMCSVTRVTALGG
mmetsp:Transcript_10035/g.38001  ORF Transcript_10035/g.38001 Transcript_10035/m.38001 type:complete len:423 (-) Transcript_10035:369-1637(-)